MTPAAVVGLGLIGGSAARALQAPGYDRDPGVRSRARELGLAVADTLGEAVAGAGIVLVAVPGPETPGLLREVARAAPSAILTDTASLKEKIAAGADGLPAGSRFVAGHPMAGSHRRGIEEARGDLFRDRPWALVRTARSDDASVSEVRAMVERTGARPVEIEAAAHDRAMTWLSHLPLSVSAALARAASAAAAGGAPLAGPGYLDTTRVAAQPVSLSLELALARPEALADAADAVSRELSALAGALRGADAAAVRRFFEDAAAARRDCG